MAAALASCANSLAIGLKAALHPRQMNKNQSMLLMNMGSCFQAASLFQAALVFSGCLSIVHKASKLVPTATASTAAA